MLWKGFQRPKRLEFERETLTDRFGRFHAQPFERGFGTTVGNALRRVLLSSSEGAAGTAGQTDHASPNFLPYPGVAGEPPHCCPTRKPNPPQLSPANTHTPHPS